MTENRKNDIDPGLYEQVAKFGAKDMEICMQCGNCSAACPLSQGVDTFPRKIYRCLQLGLKKQLLSAPEPWLCYYCGECNTDCPRGAEPAETMMAVRRWLTTQYDWTGLARRLYLSKAWEIGALSTVALAVILLFVFFHGPVITEYMAVNTFAPVLWIEIGDLAMAGVLTFFLLSNAFRMYRFIMAGTHVPFKFYITEARTFLIHFATQKQWRVCSEDKTRWLKHFILVTGYMTMMTLIIICIRWFQVDDTSWHFTSIFGYYATAVLLFITWEMMQSRRKQKETIHRYSEPTDWLFLILLFSTTLTGIFMHMLRLTDWPLGTYIMYVIHLAIAVPMLVIEVPFGKWSHMFYRPLAKFLTTIKEKYLKTSRMDMEKIKSQAGETFLQCMQCGTCSGICPLNHTISYNPRLMLRQVAHNSGSQQTLDQAAWACVSCNACGVNCPRGIEISDFIKTMRTLNIENRQIPVHAEPVLNSLSTHHNPWNIKPENRLHWSAGLDIPESSPEHEYCLFTCCTSVYNAGRSEDDQKKVQMLPKILNAADISYGTLGTDENCCGDPAHMLGENHIFSDLMSKNSKLFSSRGIKKIITTSPHCMNSFKKYYTALTGSVTVQHYTELLDELIDKGRLKPAVEIDQVVTFHDPCYLGRHNNIFDSPRRILKSIPGLKLIEMADNRENALCCGAGAGGIWQNRSVKDNLGVVRVKQALASGAAIIATACPFCIRMLDDAVHLTGAEDRIVVQDLTRLLFKSLKITNNNTPYMTRLLNIDQEDEHV